MQTATTKQQSRRHRGTLPYVRSQEVILSYPHREGDLSEAAREAQEQRLYSYWR